MRVQVSNCTQFSKWCLQRRANIKVPLPTPTFAGGLGLMGVQEQRHMKSYGDADDDDGDDDDNDDDGGDDNDGDDGDDDDVRTD